MRSVLFVDDEPALLRLLRDRMTPHSSWELSFALGGEAALEQLEKRTFDVIVSDMRMPGLDGATLLRRVQIEHPRTVRIILSGYAELEAALRAVPVAHQFLTKPTEPQVLENVIERACSLHALIGDESVRSMVGKVQKLPSLPRVYSELLRELSNERTGAREVAQIIERDIAMSAKILQLVNSAFFGLGRPIASVQDAVTYLGFSLVKSLVLTVEVFEMEGAEESGGFSLDALQKHSLSVAEVATRMFGEQRPMKEQAFLAAVLHDIGKLVMAQELPRPFADVRSRALESGRPQHEIERECFGTTHAEMGGYLLGLWGLPYNVVEAVANHHRPERVPQRDLDLLTVVHVANALVHEYAPASDGTSHPALDPRYLERLGLADRLDEWREIAGEQARTWADD